MVKREKLIFWGGLVLFAFLVVVNFFQVLVLKAEVGEIKISLKKGFITPAPTVTKSEPIEIVGRIQYSDIEGGCWYLQPEVSECKGDKCPLGQSPNYEPLNLPKELQRAGLKAKFKLEVQTGVATICQLGPVVGVLEYQIIK